MTREVGPLKLFLQQLHRRDVWRALVIFVDPVLTERAAYARAAAER